MARPKLEEGVKGNYRLTTKEYLRRQARKKVSEKNKNLERQRNKIDTLARGAKTAKEALKVLESGGVATGELLDQAPKALKDAIKQGLLEINRLKKVKSQVNVVTQTIVDTFVVSHTDTIVQYFEGGAFLKLPQSYTYLTNDISFGAEVTEKGLKVNNISIENSASITIGYKGNGLFRKKTPVVELVNSNPYVQTNSVSNVVIEEKPNPLTDPKIWGGVGFLIGLFIQ